MVGGVASEPLRPPTPAAQPAPRPPAPRADAETWTAASDDRAHRITAEVVDVALASIGTPYEWGGTDANGFDCSGLIQFAYSELGIRLPRTSAAQIRAGSPVALGSSGLRPGDILGFSDGGGPKTEHVGLYVGDNQFIHSTSGGVRISTLRNGYWQDRLVAVRRIVD